MEHVRIGERVATLGHGHVARTELGLRGDLEGGDERRLARSHDLLHVDAGTEVDHRSVAPRCPVARDGHLDDAVEVTHVWADRAHARAIRHRAVVAVRTDNAIGTVDAGLADLARGPGGAL